MLKKEKNPKTEVIGWKMSVSWSLEPEYWQREERGRERDPVL